MLRVCIGVTKGDERLSEWFTLPISEEEFSERLGVSFSGEYSIIDYEAPFDIKEDTSIEILNDMDSKYEEIISWLPQIVADSVLKNNFRSIDKLLGSMYEVRYYPDCHTSKDLAYQYIEERGGLQGYEDYREIYRYFDFEAFGRDMIKYGSYLFCDYGAIYVE